MDGGFLSVGKKAIGAATRPALKYASEQWHRRDAGLKKVDPATIDRELNEGLVLLLGEEQTAIAALTVWAKAKLSARPTEFDEPHTKDWLRANEVQAILKEAARAFMLEQPIDAHRDIAQKLYHAQSQEFEWYGGALFDTAVAFLVLTVTSKLSPGDRFLGDMIKGEGELVRSDIAALTGRFENLSTQLLAVPEEYPTDLLGEHIRRFLYRETRLRSMIDEMRLARVLVLADKAYSGVFRNAPDADKAELFRFTAAMLARSGRPGDAPEWLARAAAAGARDLEPDHARVAYHDQNVPLALELLRGRSDPLSNSLALDALESRDGKAAALSYYVDHLSPEMLSAYGLGSVAHWMTLAGDWDGAEALFASMSDEQVEEHPLLLLLRARLRLIMMLPVAHRHDQIETIATFPQIGLLRDDPEGARLRCAALEDLAALEAIAVKLDAEALSDLVHLNRLFLQLSSGEAAVREPAEDELTRLLSDSASHISYVHLAHLFQFKFDDAVLRSRLQQAKALAGWTSEELLAAVHLEMRERDFDSILRFVAENRDRMAAELAPALAYGLEIEALAKKGRVDDARERFAEVGDRLDPVLTELLSNIIAEESGEDGLALRMAAYEKSGSDQDLDHLLQKLVERGDPRAGEHAAQLWRLRHVADDAVIACNAFFDAGADDALDDFLVELGDAVGADLRLREHQAWADYRNGRLADARLLLESLRIEQPHRASLRQLEINVTVEEGDWRRLLPLIRQDLEFQDRRSVKQLIQSAGLAVVVADPIADDLARTCVAKAPDDPDVLVSAYQIAVRRGQDWGSDAAAWLRRAIELSADTGPVQRGNLRELVRMRQEGEQRGQKIDRQIMNGDVPLGLAVRPLNTTLSEIVLGKLASNRELEDARQRLCMPFMAGNRQSWDIGKFNRIAFDPSAIFALHLVGLLGEALRAFGHVVIPAGTFPLLLNDLERSSRGQPTRAAQAAKIKKLVADGKLTVFENGEGDGLERAYTEAKDRDGCMVHSVPLYVPGSFREEERDSAPFADRLVSPQGVVEALLRIAQLSADEAAAASANLETSAPAWPEEPAVDLGRPLVIDDGALHMLDHAGVLDRLVAEGATLIVSASVAVLADWSIEQDRLARELGQAIEGLRHVLHQARVDGHVSIGRFQRKPLDFDEADDVDTEAIELTPLLSLLADAAAHDLVVSGERIVNQHGRAGEDENGPTFTATPIDVVEHLFCTGKIAVPRLNAAIRDLRDCGVALVPVLRTELSAAAVEGDWTRGPGRNLKAICQSIHLALARRTVVLPTDTGWLASLPTTFATAIRNTWAECTTVDAAVTAADYLLLNLPDVAAYAAVEGGPDAKTAMFPQLLAFYALLALPLDMPKDRMETYRAWHEARIEPLLRCRDAVVFPELLGRLRDTLIHKESFLSEHSEIIPQDLAPYLAAHMPRLYLDRLTPLTDVREALGLGGPAFTVIGLPVAVAAIGDFLADIAAGRPASLIALNGTLIADGGTLEPDGTISFSTEKGTITLLEGKLFSENPELRQAGLHEILANRTLSPTIVKGWRHRVDQAIPTGEDFKMLNVDLALAPERFYDRVYTTQGDLEYSALVPEEQEFYENLIGVTGEQGTLDAVLRNLSNGHASLMPAADALINLGPLAVAPGFRIAEVAAALPDAEVAGAAQSLLDKGDPFGAVAAFELVVNRLSSAECRDVGQAVVDALIGEHNRLESMAQDFCSAARVCMGTFDVVALLGTWPTSHRRYAALVQAGHVARILSQLEGDRLKILEGTLEWNPQQWRLHTMLDRHDDGEWTRDWLHPAAIAGNVLKRLLVAMSQIPPEIRPRAWDDALFARAGSGPTKDPYMTVPGPLDKFDSSAISWPEDDPVSLFEGADPHDSQQMLGIVAGFLMTYSLPSDTSQLFDLTMDAINLAEPSDAIRLIDAALRVASRWNLAELADRIWEWVWRANQTDRIPSFILPVIAVAVGASRADVAEGIRHTCELLQRLSATQPQHKLRSIAELCHQVSNRAGWSGVHAATTFALLGMVTRKTV